MIDFGLAHFCHRAHKNGYKNKARECSHPANSVCAKCMARKEKRVPRSGTPGYRAPEILLKYLNQTSAIDIWSCGVILISLLSKKFPFFTAIGDMSSLAEIVGVFGSETCIHAANEIGISLTISEFCEGVSVDTLCKQSVCREKGGNDLILLLSDMLDVNCLSRISAEQALNTFDSI